MPDGLQLRAEVPQALRRGAYAVTEAPRPAGLWAGILKCWCRALTTQAVSHIHLKSMHDAGPSCFTGNKLGIMHREH